MENTQAIRVRSIESLTHDFAGQFLRGDEKEFGIPGFGRFLDGWIADVADQNHPGVGNTEFELRAEKGAFGVWGVLFEPMALILTWHCGFWFDLLRQIC